MTLRCHPFLPVCAIAFAVAACGRQPEGAGTTAAPSGAGPGTTGAGGDCAPADMQPTNDRMSATRVLRRIDILLAGRPPTDDEYQAVIDAEDDGAREALLDAAVDAALASPQFYETMRDFGREWMGLTPIPAIADEPDYMGSQQRNVAPCPAGTTYEGALSFFDSYKPGNPPCSGTESDGSPALVKNVEPWWAPGTTVQIVGHAADDTVMMTDPYGKPYDCGAETGLLQWPACGCGPNLAWCHPSPSVGYANWPIYAITNPTSQRRYLWEEPARLFAHLAYYDRPLTDLVTGAYSVGPVDMQAAYVRMGRRLGAKQLDSDDTWWRTSKLSGAVDPFHDDKDPAAWREFDVPARNPYLLADRAYRFDPRVEPRGSMKGVPAAGVLTMIGMLGSYPRERVRAARMLETFACEAFVPPPADQQFNPYDGDPAASGPCQTCHTRIDPAAIHFKRWAKLGYDIDMDRGRYLLLGVGTSVFDDAWATSVYPYGGDPFLHWLAWFKPGSKMTPVTDADAQKNLETVFIDYLPPDQTLLGQTSDGTVGPLGLGKIIVAAGAFDRCAVMRLHERFGGRAIDRGQEAGYLDALVEEFVAGGRKVRPFLKALTKSDVFRRGL